MSLHVTTRHVTSRHVSSRLVSSRLVTSRHVTSLHVTACHYTLCHVTSRHKSPHVTTRHYTSLHVTTCHKMSLPCFALRLPLPLRLRRKRRDLHCIVPATAIIAGRGRVVRLRNGRFDWTLQVGYPPSLTESGARRRAQEKAIRMKVEFLQTNIAEAKQRSTPILKLDLNSRLGLKGSE